MLRPRFLSTMFVPFALFLAVGIATTANADVEASSQPEGAALFKRLDANGDGQVAQDEVPDGQRRLFGRLLRRGDGNADGKLSLEEFTKALADERPEPRPAD